MQVTPLISSPDRRSFRLVSGRPVTPENAVSTQKVIQHVPDWILDAEYNRFSPRTIEIKKLALDKFIAWLLETGKTDVSAFVIKSYIAHISNTPTRRGQELSMRSVEVYFINIRSYMRWLVREGIITECPAETVTVPKPRKPEIKPFTPDQVRLLLNACKRTTAPERDTAILSLLIDSGLRASELCGLKLMDVNLTTTHGTVTVTGKGNKKRTVPFSRETARAIWIYLQANPREPHCQLFTGNRGLSQGGRVLTRSGLQQLFNRLESMTRVTGVRCSPHTCRHTFAIEFLRAGGNLLALQLMLGHESLEMTRIYAKLAAADVANQHRDHSPLAGILHPGK